MLLVPVVGIESNPFLRKSHSWHTGGLFVFCSQKKTAALNKPLPPSHKSVDRHGCLIIIGQSDQLLTKLCWKKCEFSNS